MGSGILGETQDLDPRPAMGFHGAIVGGLSLHGGLGLGATALTLGALGAVGGAYFSWTRVDSTSEAIAVGVAPFVGAMAGGVTFAVVHFFNDIGPRATGRLVRFVGVGMLVGTVGSFAYAFKDRSEAGSTMRVGSVMRRDDLRLLSFGGAF